MSRAVFLNVRDPIWVACGGTELAPAGALPRFKLKEFFTHALTHMLLHRATTGHERDVQSCNGIMKLEQERIQASSVLRGTPSGTRASRGDASTMETLR